MGTTAKSDAVESEDECVICLSPVTLRAVTVPCSHLTFDFICLLSWLKERSTCPLCKTQVSAIQYDWRSPEDFKTYNIPPSPKQQDRVSSHSTEWPLIFAPHGLPRRPRSSRCSYSPPIEDRALHRRREIYRQELYSLHVGSNPFSGYHDLTPQMIASSSELQSRARMWIRRELQVFTFLYRDAGDSSGNEQRMSGNAEFVLSYIVSILKIVDIKASNGHAENLVTEFLGRKNARLFLHELNSWLRSPYTKLDQWDTNVQYAEEA